MRLRPVVPAQVAALEAEREVLYAENQALNKQQVCGAVGGRG